MAKVWQYLGLDFDAHDFENVEQYTKEYDVGWPYGDHTIRSTVRPLELDYNEILGKQLSTTLKEKFNWINTL